MQLLRLPLSIGDLEARGLVLLPLTNDWVLREGSSDQRDPKWGRAKRPANPDWPQDDQPPESLDSVDPCLRVRGVPVPGVNIRGEESNGLIKVRTTLLSRLAMVCLVPSLLGPEPLHSQ